ncbi:MAG: hypothetical protein K1X89_03625 [Myxococcaceae bacterium]|nr:hypothetical protein [Myxococcaceae bacterium]
MSGLTREEGFVLEMAHVALGLKPTYDAQALLTGAVEPPAKLGPTAREVLSDTLAKGVVYALAHKGGWRSEAGKRLWERLPDVALEFSGASISLLRFMLQQPQGAAGGPELAFEHPKVGDVLLLALALRHLADGGLENPLRTRTAVRNQALCWLVAPEVLAPVGPPPKLDFDTPAVRLALAGWQGFLAQRWSAAQALHAEHTSPDAMRALGKAQDLVLTGVLESLELPRRADAGFVLDAAASHVGPQVKAETYGGKLSAEAPLRERSEARKAAGALLRAVQRLRGWDQEHRSTRFVDDSYEQAQALVRAWERFGHERFEQAQALLQALERPV